MRPLSRLAVVVLIGWFAWAGVAVGQDAEVPDEQVEATAPPPPEPASPPPGEEVMKPTQRGIRLTRKMAEAFGKVVVRDQMDKEVAPLNEEQRERLAHAVTERMWDVKLQHAKEAGVALEYFYETILNQEVLRDKKFTPEQAREFSEKVGPGARLIGEFWEGLLDDARPILNDEQYADLEEEAQKALKMTRRFEDKMDRWSRGEIKENEGVMDGFDENDIEAEESGKSKEYVQAEQSVRWRINSLGTGDWRRFFNQASRLFEFDDAQKQAGEKILADYSKQAKAIMTPDWRAKATANRVQEQLQHKCPEEPLEPWLYHLEIEYKKLVEPVQELGRAFRREIVALAYPEQRERLLNDLRKVGADHGMSPQEVSFDFLTAMTAQPSQADVSEEAPQDGSTAAQGGDGEAQDTSEERQ
jgi:hypothetical protein